MLDKARVLIVDDGMTLARPLDGYFSRKDDIEIVGIAHSSLEAESLLSSMQLQPDIIILDIAKPKPEGFPFLEHINVSKCNKAPKVLVLSALGQASPVNRAYAWGEAYFIVKPFDVERLYRSVMVLRNENHEVQPRSSNIICRRLDKRITNVLLSIGIPSRIKGFEFLRIAIEMAVNDPEIIKNLSKRLYPQVSAVCNAEKSVVQRGIRKAIEIAWTKGSIDSINELYGCNIYSKERPANGEFIALAAYKFQTEKKA